MLIDTHCHIHDEDYPLDIERVMSNAHQVGVDQIICVGTSAENSQRAIEFANNHEGVFASAGVHPHEAGDGIGQLAEIVRFATLENFSMGSPIQPVRKLVAIGEIGLDYHYNNIPRDIQIQVLRSQIELALKHNLPIIFHVREAFGDFWPIFDSYSGIRGVLHSFTDIAENAYEALKRGLYIGVNGYSTFTKDESQKTMFASLPLDRILIETDAPYLTPMPFRGKVNEPAFVRNIAEFHGFVRQIPVAQIENITTANARKLFNF